MIYVCATEHLTVRDPSHPEPLHPPAGLRIADVEALPDDRLRVRSNNTSEGDVDLSRLILGPDAGVFAVLRDEALFRRVHVALGAVTGRGDLDLAPDAMYRAIRGHANGWSIDMTGRTTSR